MEAAFADLSTALFNSLSEALEVKARTHSVNEKITYAAEVGLICIGHLKKIVDISLGAICPEAVINRGTYAMTFVHIHCSQGFLSLPLTEWN